MVFLERQRVVRFPGAAVPCEWSSKSIPQNHQPSFFKPKCSSSPKRCINKAGTDTVGSKGWLRGGNVNLVEEMPLPEGCILEDDAPN